MKYLKISAFVVLVVLWSCAADGPGTEATAPISSVSLPGSYGRPNQVFVIADSTLWKGMAGDSFYYYFSAPYLLLPQPEPIFDIQHMTPEDLAKAPAKKEFKSFIFLADMNDKSSITSQQVLHDVGAVKVEEARIGKGYTTIVAQNKWALNQQLFYFIGFGPEKLAENISKNFPPVARRINDRDEKMIEANAYQSGTNNALEADMASSFAVDIKLPGDFKKIIYNGNNRTVWLRGDDRDIVANVLIHRRPYKSEDQLTYEGIKSIRNEVGRIVESPVIGSYMRINDIDLPMFVEKKTVNGLYTVQARGIWEMVKDFKGGAFISNLMLDQDRGELIFVDGFLYAPSINKKRNYMQEIELIVSSVEPMAVEN